MIGENIKRYRVLKGLSLRNFGELVNMSQTAIMKYEKDILGGLGPAIVICAILIGIIAIGKHGVRFSAVEAALEAASVTKVKGGWLWSALLYPACNAIIVIFLSCCIGSTAASEKEATNSFIQSSRIFIFSFNKSK